MRRSTSVLIAVFIVIVVGGALAIGLHGGGSVGSTCKAAGKPTAHVVVIKDDRVSDSGVRGKRCDTLTITNDDAVVREIAFGLHEHQEAYDGVAERVLGRGQSLTITFTQIGSFRWHDHIHDEVQGYFMVTNN